MGNSGGIVINAGTLEVTKGAQLTTTTFGRGNSGSIQVTATDRGEVVLTAYSSTVTTPQRLSKNHGGCSER